MPNQIDKRKYVPSRKYDIQIHIRDIDFSNDLVSCQIVETLNSIYTIVKLELFVDARNIITEITGEDPIKLSVIQLGEGEGVPKQRLDLEIMYLKSEYSIPLSPKIYTDKQTERVSLPLVCVTRKPFKIMSSFVNKIYIGKTIRDILQDLVNSTKTNSKLVLDSVNLNNNVLDQVVVPPTTLTNAIDILDETFGIFKGITHSHCSYKNEVHVSNLTQKMNDSPKCTLYQLATDTDNTEKIKKTVDGKTFYTYDMINTDNSDNVKFSIFSKKMRHISKPVDTLYYKIEEDLGDITTKYGLIDKNKKIQLDPNIDDRTRYYVEHTGYNKDNTFVISNMSKLIANMSNINFRLERDVSFLTLIDSVGECVKFNSETSEYVNLVGKYIMKTVLLDFNRTRDWNMIASLYLMRSNRYSV
jgi:hypothetical protein